MRMGERGTGGTDQEENARKDKQPPLHLGSTPVCFMVKMIPVSDPAPQHKLVTENLHCVGVGMEVPPWSGMYILEWF